MFQHLLVSQACHCDAKKRRKEQCITGALLPVLHVPFSHAAKSFNGNTVHLCVDHNYHYWIQCHSRTHALIWLHWISGIGSGRGDSFFMLLVKMIPFSANMPCLDRCSSRIKCASKVILFSLLPRKATTDQSWKP